MITFLRKENSNKKYQKCLFSILSFKDIYEIKYQQQAVKNVLLKRWMTSCMDIGNERKHRKLLYINYLNICK